MSTILLVDDQPAHASHYRRIFRAVDVCTDYGELTKAIHDGKDWSAAFVDFDLSGMNENPQPTGLSALRLLMQCRPETRRIAYTTLTDNGRILYAAAAYRWLQTAVILDKSSADRALRDAADPHAPNPTAPAWRQKLSSSAFLIDDLFARYNWLALWQIWRYYDGSIKVISDHLPPGNTPASVRDFSEHATDAMNNFRDAFYGPRPTNVRAQQRGPRNSVGGVSDANSKFFVTG